MITLKSGFDKFSQVSDQSWELVQSIMIKQNLKKNEVFCKEGQVYENEFIIDCGIVRGYYQTFQGQDINVYFLRCGDIATPFFYRSIKGKSIVNFQAITKSTIYEFDAKTFVGLMSENIDLAAFGKAFVDYQLKQKTLKEIYLLSKSAEDRIHYFREIYPNLENEIPHYHIASFLGITPISLSRLRKKMANK